MWVRKIVLIPNPNCPKFCAYIFTKQTQIIKKKHNLFFILFYLLFQNSGQIYITAFFLTNL